MKKMIALAALAAASVSASAATNLFTDGSFESISQAAGTWNTYHTVAGWTVTQAGFLPSSHGLEIRNGVAAASEGFDAVVLSGGVSSASLVGNAASSGWLQERSRMVRGRLVTRIPSIITASQSFRGSPCWWRLCLIFPPPARSRVRWTRSSWSDQVGRPCSTAADP